MPIDLSPGHRSPLVLPRSEHSISRQNIDDDALRVLYRLVDSTYESYLVGGGVRDLFLEKTPKDFDLATAARPSRVRKMFRNCRVVGRRFKIAHVTFPGDKVIEVATFRRGVQRSVVGRGGKTMLDDNEYGSAEEDALRRDLTINGLFYDAKTFSVIDYVGGVEDLRAGIIRMINPPGESFAEDPVRMIRAQRHAARLGFEVDAETWDAIEEHRSIIADANPSRLLEETLKDLRSGAAEPYYRLIASSGLADALFPPLAVQLRQQGEQHPLWGRLRALDKLIWSGATYTTPVLLSAAFHSIILPDPAWWSGERPNPPDAQNFMLRNLRELTRVVRIARRDADRMTQIALHHRRLRQSLERGKLFSRLAHKEYLSEALDFLEIALAAEGKSTELVERWREVAPPPVPYSAWDDRPPRAAGEGQRASAGETGAAEDSEKPRRRRRRRGGRRRRPRTE